MPKWHQRHAPHLWVCHVQEALLLMRQRRDRGQPHEERRHGGRQAAARWHGHGAEPLQRKDERGGQREGEEGVEEEGGVAEVEVRRLGAVARALAAADDIVCDEVPQRGLHIACAVSLLNVDI